MKKFVYESLQELFEGITSGENRWADDQIDQYFGKSQERSSTQEEMSLDEWENTIDKLISLNNAEAAFMKMDNIIQTHPEMQTEGWPPIPEEYMTGLTRLVDHYKEHIQKDFDYRMN